ncbi:MAG: filamentous hemagglutinin N-terminal domain-containing protein, partial [Pseudohongiellaceae bacterium]
MLPLAFLIPLLAYGQSPTVVFDDSFGAVTLEPDFGDGGVYQILDSYGEKAGGNLFHSFQTFGVSAGDTATFEVGAGVENVISRVTGGLQSDVYGTINVDQTVGETDANFWMINSAGFVVHDGAEIDIGGIFNSSDADYIEFSSTDRLYSTTDSSVSFSVDPTEFGFLDDVTFDATLGAVTTPGDFGKNGNYQIEEDIGTKNAANLFYSFDKFSVPKNGSVTFQVGGGITNVISRVTGGSPSIISGAISVKDIDDAGDVIADVDPLQDGANFWMINPAGWTELAGSSYDIGAGLFEVGAADYIRFGGNERLYLTTEDFGPLSTSPLELGFYQDIAFDKSIGTHSSDFAPDASGNYLIEQGRGQKNGTNLFHSFETFSVPAGASALFQADSEIVHVISRVTGPLESEIDGLIEVQGGVGGLGSNFWFINPAGITFQDGARIDVGSMFDFNVGVAGSISLAGAASYLADRTKEEVGIDFTGIGFAGNPVNLSVANLSDQDGSLLLEGVYFIHETSDFSNLRFLGGQVDLTSNSTISTFADVNSTKISIIGNNVTLKDSQIYTGTNSLLDGGSIDVFAAHGIVLKDQILSATSDDDGNAGSIRLSTGISGTITLNTSTLQSFAFNEGDAGSISVGLPLDEVTDAPLFDGETGAFQASGASASVIFNGATLRSDVLPKVPESLVIPSGDSGSITIAASNEVTLNTNGGANQTFITAESYGEGNAGNITIAAGGKIVANEGEGFFGAGVAIGVDSKKAYSGRVGDILIQAPIINLNRAIFGVDSFSELTNPAGKIELIATTEVGNTDSGSLTLTNFLLRSGTWGNGNAGATNASSVKLVGDSIVLNDSSGWAGGGGIRAQTGGRGNAGEVRIEGNTIELTGVSILDENTVVERIGGVVQTDGPGKKKKIPFEDTDLSQRINLGSPGRVTINGTESVSLSQSSISTLTIGENTDPPQTSINITSIKKGLSGEIESRGIVILSDSELTAETLAGSPAGDIEVLGDSISLNSSDLFATTSGSGAAGSILIEGVTSITANTDSGVTLDSNNIPNGNNATSFYDLIYGPEGGDGPIEDPAMTNIKSSSSESTSGRAGDITIRANRLDIRGGNVASTTRAIPPEGKEHEGATILLEASDGDLDLINTLVRADSFGTTDAGNIKISAESLSEDVNARVLFARSRAVSDTWSSGNAGTIDVTGDVVILNGSFIGEDATFIQSQSNAGTGEAGDINILGRAGVYANKDDREKYGLYTAISSQSNSTFSGKAGIVKISTDSGGEINLANTVITAATDSDEALNLPGEITLMAEDGDLVLLESVVRAETFGNSPAAGILLSAYDITYSGGKGASSSVEAPSIKSSTEGAGAAGDIKVFGSNKTILDNVILASTTQFGGGDAGLIQIGNALVNELGEVIASSSVVEIRNGTTISATGGGTGRAGTVQIFGKDSITIDASTLESSTKGSENGGDITIGAWLGEDNQPIDYSEQVILKENTVVEGKTTSEGDAANISVFGNEITLDSGVSIVTNTERSSTAANPQGDAGNINILAGNYSEDGEFLWGQIRSNASLDDNPVTISSDSFFAHLMMNEEGQFELVLKENPSEIERAGLGIAGNVSLQAGTIELNDANIAATTASNVATIERNDVGEIISDNSASVKIVAHTDALTLIDVAVTVSTSGKSSAGSINVFGPLATTLDSATLESSTSGAGDAGLVTVGAQLDEDRQIVNYSDVVTLKNDSLISGTTSGSGVAGTINLFGNTISLSNGTEITSTTSSGGAAGDIAIKAGQADAGDIFVWGLLESIASPGNPIRISSDSIVLQQEVDGTGAPILDDEGKVQLVENENPSEAERDGLGIAGDVSIQAGEIDLTDANIAATTAGNTTTIEKNDAGEVISDTSASVSIVANTDALTLTDVEVAVSTSGRSSAGSINVFGPLATTLDSATLESSTSGAGDAGLVTVGAQLDEDRQIVNYSDVVTLKNDSLISGTTSGSGVAGTINLFGNTISLSNGTEITSTTSSGGAAGDIAIKAGQADAGDIFVWGLLESIASPGNPIRISSDSIVLQQEVDGTGAPILDDEGKVQLVESENPSESERDGLGIAGNVSIQAGKIELNDASIAATTASNTITLVKDDAGEVISDSSASVTLFAATEALILNDVEVAVSTSGKSTAGSIDIFSTDSIALNGSTVIEATTTGLGNAGSIELESNTITTRGDADERVTIASESLLSDSGAPGAITLLANTIDLLNTDVRGTTATNTPHPDASASVKIAATDGDLTLESTLLEVSTSGANNAGELQLAGQNIVVRGDAKISSTTSSSGNAGSFSLGSAAAKVDNVTLEGGATLTATTSGSGDAGNISINARSIIARGDATNLVNIVTESENESSGAAGSIELLGDVIELANTRISATTASNALDSSPASVRLTAAAGDLILNSSVVEVSSTGSSAAGTIDLSGVALELQDTTVSSATSAEGDAGLIALVGADDSEIDRISLREGTTITATTSGAGNAGSIEVIGKHIESRDASIISESTVVDASGEAIDPSTITADQRAGVGAAGDLLIDASESLDLVGGEFKTRTVSDD